MNIIEEITQNSPKPLKKGDTIGFLTVSGPIYEQERVERARKYFEDAGYKVVISDTTYTQKDFLSADDETRAKEIHKFFTDANIDAILCTRGGYGATRLLDKIDYDLIRKNPKIFGGFSDATAFLLAFYKHSGLLTYHSPMPNPDFGGETVSEYTAKSMFKAFNGKFKDVKLDGKIYYEGTAKGILWGGNLTTIASMVGFDFVPEENFIFFIEDVNEPAYKIDRYFTQLAFDKNFRKNIKGLAVGEFTGLDESVFADNIFTEIGKKYNIPVISGLKIGHVKEKLTLPVGGKCSLNTAEKALKF